MKPRVIIISGKGIFMWAVGTTLLKFAADIYEPAPLIGFVGGAVFAYASLKLYPWVSVIK